MSLEARLRAFGVTDEEMKEPLLNKSVEDVHYSTALIRKELECPICLRIMKEPVISRSCGHVYCKECIEKYIRQDKFSRKCPSCRISITNRRHLVREPFLEQLVRAVFPDIDEHLKHEEEIIMKVVKKREVAQNVVVNSVADPIHQQEEKVDFLLVNDPETNAKPLKEPYIRVSAAFKVASLLKLLEQLTRSPSPRSLSIRSKHGEKIGLVKEMRISEVKEFWDPENPSSWIVYFA